MEKQWGQRKHEGPFRGVKALVHNVSHSDMLLGLQLSEEETNQFTIGGVTPNDSGSLIARPQYSKFQPCSMTLLSHLDKIDDSEIEILKIPMILSNGATCPTAYGLTFSSPSLAASWSDYHLRPTVKKEGLLKERVSIPIRHVYFPLMASILYNWEMGDTTENKKIIYLLSGEGNSRNPAHGTYDNSTEGTAKLLKMFINTIYPTAIVVLVHSREGIFKYKQNVKFVNDMVTPLLCDERQLLAEKYGESWKKNFNVTISLSDGPSARLLAVSACMREFEPSFLHMWQPKSFFHFGVLREDDIECHSYDLVEAQPSVNVNALQDPHIRELTEQMIEHKRKFSMSEENELANFWLRKTKKPVLCVLMYQKPNENPIFICGMNIEVSMPTGTLCSERNAIGTALANDPSLSRQHFKMIAVLSLALENGEQLNPLDPCGSCTEWLRKIAEVNPDFKVITFSDMDCKNIFIKSVH